MAPRILAIFLSSLFSYLAIGQTNYEDSIQTVLKNESVDSVKINLLLELAERFVRTDAVKFQEYSAQAYDLSLASSFNKGLVSSSLNMGYFHRVKAQYDSSLLFYNKALEACEEANKRIANIHYSIGNVFKAKGEFVKATESYLASLSFAEKNESTKDAAIAQLGLGSLYLLQNKISEALEFFLKTSESFRQIEDKRGIYISANNIGSCYFKLGEYEQAKEYFLTAKKLAVAYNDRRGLGNIFGNLGSIFREEKRYDSAIWYGNEALKIREKFQNKGETIISYHSLAELHIALRQFRKAEQYLNKALTLSEEIESTEELKFNWNYRAMLDTARGDFKSAFNSLQNYYTYRARLEEKEVKSDIEELQTKYETEKKEAEIISLTQKSSIQALEIKQKNQGIIIGSVAVLFMLVAIYFIYQQREAKKRQSQTELEQRFLRSQLNPHFISNALVAVQSFMLKNDSDSAALYLTKFSKLMRETLENSRKEFITVDEEVSMLKNYMDIHKQRLGSFDYTVDLDEAIDPETDTIPPMFVQPFVENAVEHGVGSLREGGKIELKFRKEGEFINIAVNDNGKGLTPNADSDHHSLSTTIIQERIDLFNQALKNKIQLVIDNIKNESGEVSGTKVELKVPFSYL